GDLCLREEHGAARRARVADQAGVGLVHGEPTLDRRQPAHAPNLSNTSSASLMMRLMSSATDGSSSIRPTTWPLAITPRSGRTSTIAFFSSMGVLAAITTWLQLRSWAFFM